MEDSVVFRRKRKALKVALKKEKMDSIKKKLENA
jgi:hypothetical protein